MNVTDWERGTTLSGETSVNILKNMPFGTV